MSCARSPPRTRRHHGVPNPFVEPEQLGQFSADVATVTNVGASQHVVLNPGIKLDGRSIPSHREAKFVSHLLRHNLGAELRPEHLHTHDARDMKQTIDPAIAAGTAEAVIDRYREILDRRRSSVNCD